MSRRFLRGPLALPLRFNGLVECRHCGCSSAIIAAASLGRHDRSDCAFLTPGVLGRQRPIAARRAAHDIYLNCLSTSRQDQA